MLTPKVLDIHPDTFAILRRMYPTEFRQAAEDQIRRGGIVGEAYGV
jgi:hypothetical protein